MTMGFTFLFCMFFCSYSAAQRKNVLLIVIDDLRPALGCYNDINAYTPNIDKLAKGSIVFQNAYAQQALCAPSRNSFLTSRRPDTIRLYDFYSYWRESAGNFTTLPQHFRENGYQTKSIGKIFHPGISSNWSDDQPYSWSDKPYHPPTQRYQNSPVCHSDSGQPARNLICPVTVQLQPEKSLPDIQTLEAAQEFLSNRIQDIPFFLAVGFHKPHVPLKFPREYLDYHPIHLVNVVPNHWRPPSLPTVAWNPWTDVRKRDDIAALNLSFPFGIMPEEESKRIRQSYYAATSFIDDLVGQLLDSIKSFHYEKNTIIIVTGDHGWSLGEHGEWAKYSNFEVSVHVPLILYVPGVTDAPAYIFTNDVRNSNIKRSHHISTILVELVDLFPTLVDLSGVSNPLQPCTNTTEQTSLCTEGVSFAPVLFAENVEGIEKKWKSAAFSQYPRPGLFPTVKPNSDKPHLKEITYMGYSMRTYRHRYTEWVLFNKGTFQPDWSNVVAKELYDHTADPMEDLNIADRPQLNDLIQSLSRQLHLGWRHSLPTETINHY